MNKIEPVCYVKLTFCCFLSEIRVLAIKGLMRNQHFNCLGPEINIPTTSWHFAVFQSAYEVTIFCIFQSLFMSNGQSINQSSLFLSLCLVFLHLLEYKNKLREYWLPRITDKLIMIGSQFMHMFTAYKFRSAHTIDKHTTVQNV